MLSLYTWNLYNHTDQLHINKFNKNTFFRYRNSISKYLIKNNYLKNNCMQSCIVILLTIAKIENNQLPSMEHFWKIIILMDI